MKRVEKLTVFSGLLLFLGTGISEAVSSSSPYSGIEARNVFGLKPPAPQVKQEDEKPPPGNITLTGITTILGNKRALLRVSTPPRPPAQAKEENYMLTEGQRDGEVEVLEIDEKAGSVKVNNAGQIATLTFDKNGAKPSANPAPVTGGVPLPIPPPNPSPGIGATTAPQNIPRTIPTRGLRGMNNNSSPNTGTPSLGSGGVSSQAQQSSDGMVTHLSAEEQALMIELERERTKHQVEGGQMPALPYTPATPKELIPDTSQTQPQ